MKLTALLALSLTTLAVFPADSEAQLTKKLFGKKANSTETERAADKVDLEEYTGVRHAIGITDFENQAGWRSQWELGNNMAMMLESALFETDRFVIVERQDLGDVIAEQDLQASGRAAEAKTVAQTGLIRSAKYIATGAVTRVSENTSGDAGGIRIKGIRLGGGSNKAEIEVVVKLIDTTTSQVVASERVLGKAGGTKLRVGVYHNGVSANLDSFAKTPIGEAAQDCISEAAKFIAKAMEDFDITANVVLAKSAEQIVVSIGTNYGLEPGYVFAVREEGEILTDPSTGEVLDVFEGEVTASLEVTRVSEKIAYCKLVEGVVPERGDVVVLSD